MLVLSRKRGESIVIGDDIHVTVVEIRGDKVKLGFVGPNDVPIHREEVFRRILAESQPTCGACT
jgi:carbon storage regulator